MFHNDKQPQRRYIIMIYKYDVKNVDGEEVPAISVKEKVKDDYIHIDVFNFRMIERMFKLWEKDLVKC